MKIDFDAFTDAKKRNLYKRLWDRESFAEFQPYVSKTEYHGMLSVNSYMFHSGGSGEECLRKVFGIEYPDVFKVKYLEACSGNGQEQARINTLHSSSLCALLFFYNVTPDNPLETTVNGRKVVFTSSVFEHKNNVLPGHTPSNIDVVLLGHASDNKAVILFLESKFSEYYLDAKQRSAPISCDYLRNAKSGPLYAGSVMSAFGFQASRRDADSGVFHILSEKPAYIDGIKQMISHYVGVRNLAEAPSVGSFPGDLILDGTEVYLGEIVFDHVIGSLMISRDETALGSYQRLYRIFAREANRVLLRDGIRFAVLDELLNYSMFLSCRHTVEEKVLSFYFRPKSGQR